MAMSVSVVRRTYIEEEPIINFNKEESILNLGPVEKVANKYVQILCSLAESFTSDVIEQKRLEMDDAAKSSDLAVPTFFSLALASVREHAKNGGFGKESIEEFVGLSYTDIQRSIIGIDGVGIGVFAEFLAYFAIEATDCDGENTDSTEDKVQICTIHRAKGLEWRGVYCPFFNEGFMLFKPRDDSTSDDLLKPHLPDCGTRSGGKCDKEYKAKFDKQAQVDTHTLTLGPEEKHRDEERRLAHVTATIAKQWLCFVSVLPPGRETESAQQGSVMFCGKRDGEVSKEVRWEKSSFEEVIVQRGRLSLHLPPEDEV